VVFSSSFFLFFFFPAFLVGYILLPKQFKNSWILISSLAFYYWGAPLFIYLLVSATIIDFFLINEIYKSKTVTRKKLFLVCSLTLNLGLLAYFKYANFFIENVNSALGTIGINEVSWIKIALPIGISFYTFETLTYAIDVYRGIHAPLKRIHHYLLYILCFPKLIAGPIVRFNVIADQIPNREETTDNQIFGFYRFSIGLAKKVLIANALGEFATTTMNLPFNQLDTFTAWLGILAYTFQIYFDFSGYSDMAIGIGKIMGFSFSENFDNPYNSRSITEFWRRWHMTLGTWMKNYLYIPLGGNQVRSKSRLYFNLILVFLLSGLWHGASWNFIIWGAFHGFFLILDRMFLAKVLKAIGTIPSVIFTFIVVMIGWVFFSLENFSHAINYIKILFSFEFNLPKTLISKEFVVTLIFAAFISFIGLTRIGKQIQTTIYKEWNYSVSQALLVLFSAFILFGISASYITATGFNPFIYFRF
jgi:alginate O-acetyltransferase complex protein AlgI